MEVSSNQETSNSENSIFQERQDYINKLREWVDQARLWHSICAGFPQYYSQNHLNGESISSFVQPQLNGVINGNVIFQTPWQFNIGQGSNIQPGLQNYEFTIPPLWKRFVAEVMDFVILLVIKMLLTFFILESFNFLSFEHYGLETLQENIQNPKMVMEMSVDILVLEIVYRIVVCCYEAYWLKGGQCATPGKWYMGLMVIRAENIIPVPGRPEGIVRVQPSAPLGLQKAFIRAVLKNLFVGLMLPVCFALYIFRFNRTGYDIIASSLVVEWDHNLPFRPVE